MGINSHGGFAEYVRIHEAAVRQNNMMVIPERMSFDEAAIVEPLSCAYHGFTRCPTVPGDTVLIIDAGPIGLMHARLAKMAGASKIFMHDVSENRLALCRQLEASCILSMPVSLCQSRSQT